MRARAKGRQQERKAPHGTRLTRHRCPCIPILSVGVALLPSCGLAERALLRELHANDNCILGPGSRGRAAERVKRSVPGGRVAVAARALALIMHMENGAAVCKTNGKIKHGRFGQPAPFQREQSQFGTSKGVRGIPDFWPPGGSLIQTEGRVGRRLPPQVVELRWGGLIRWVVGGSSTQSYPHAARSRRKPLDQKKPFEAGARVRLLHTLASFRMGRPTIQHLLRATTRLQPRPCSNGKFL